jgi:hypothetical protein
MPALPQELFFALIFGAVLLAQFLYKRLCKRPKWMQTLEDSADAAPSVSSTPLAPERAPAHTRAFERPLTMPPSPAIGKFQEMTRHPRRFSRSALMPNRRAVQDAVVIANILGPCHALRTHGLE